MGLGLGLGLGLGVRVRVRVCTMYGWVCIRCAMRVTKKVCLAWVRG